ncbi:hypothetical protein [Paenirhodobacter sp. CAU 1674]|uniref:hypothetical protein n=1 Tax=Paenirhodobacter sp. CAU 1674 TaxID=3032596 RepID=UPI0023DAE4BF|nr:hypothetical protein [Paenirhodobacter sp. CAU 1674]MDF2142302.1 hypothetical protein [Paenirhodobacter sp. CAU 1674]
MKTVYKVAVAATALVLAGVATSRLINDGGIQAVMKDEVPALLDEWGWVNGSSFARYAAYIPASLAVIGGLRAGDADYDRAEHRDALTNGIPLHLHRNIMRHDNLAAAQRARSRQLQRLAAQDTEQRFFDMFPFWYASQTACLDTDAQLALIRSLAPSIATQIETTNTDFAALATKEAEGTLTVAERETYLANPRRVPHLIQTGSEWHQWTEVDPSDPLALHQSDGPLVRECPDEDHSYGGHIKSCFGYVNIDLHGYAGRSAGMGHLPPTRLGLETYRELERTGAPASFVYEMMLQVAAQVELRQQAAEIVASLPAQQVSAASVEWRVRAEYERLRCSQ